jgi:hypothetical protein
LLVPDGLGGPPVAGRQEGQVPAGLAVPDADVGAEGVGQLPGRPRPLLGEQFGHLGGYGRPAVVIRVGAGGAGVERLGAAGGEPLEGGADGVRVAAQVPGDLGRGPPGGRHQDHLQAVAGHRRQVGAAKGLEFGSLRISQGRAEHETFYASPATCVEANAKPNLTAVRGLGRSFAWGDFIDAVDRPPLFPNCP